MKTELRKEFDKFYEWLDNLTQEEYDDMSLTDKCEKFFFNSEAPSESETISDNEVSKKKCDKTKCLMCDCIKPNDGHSCCEDCGGIAF